MKWDLPEAKKQGHQLNKFLSKQKLHKEMCFNTNCPSKEEKMNTGGTCNTKSVLFSLHCRDKTVAGCSVLQALETASDL